MGYPAVKKNFGFLRLRRAAASYEASSLAGLFLFFL
jgi:hypothetical protein